MALEVLFQMLDGRPFMLYNYVYIRWPILLRKSQVSNFVHQFSAPNKRSPNRGDQVITECLCSWELTEP